MSDPVEVLLNSPRSVKAMENLGFRKEELNSLSKEELKAKLGNMKISKQDLESRWSEHEQQRKDKIQRVLEVSHSHALLSTVQKINSHSTNALMVILKIIILLNILDCHLCVSRVLSFLGEKETGARGQRQARL